MSKEPKYICPYTIRYYSERYDKWIIVPKGYPSDGATFAVDIFSEGWWCHDWIKDNNTFADGTPCTNKQASYILYDILRAERRWFRARTWFIATLTFGFLKGDK